MKIIVCGPPHSGKSVFVANLEKRLPADSFKTIRVNKDGEGEWSNNTNQDEVQRVRINQSFDDAFVALKCKEIQRAEQQIVLVDIGGKILPDKIPIFNCCDSFIILSNDEKEIPNWEAFGTENGSKCIAKIKSSLNDCESITQVSPVIEGKISDLNRGTNLDNSKLLDEVAAMLIQKSQYQKRETGDSGILDFNQLAVKLNRAETVTINDAEIIKNVHYVFEDSEQVFNEVSDFCKNRPALKMYGARANWINMIAIYAATKAGIKKISLYDANYADYIPVQKLQFGRTKKNAPVEISVLESETEAFIDFFILVDELSPSDLKNISLPMFDESTKIYFSGKIPHWLLASAVNSYKNDWKFVYQPGVSNTDNSFVCVSCPEKHELGKMYQPSSINVTEFFNLRKKEKEPQPTVYFDMDRVLVDFGKQAEKYKILKKNTRINWIKVFFLGERFWSRMEWVLGAEESFTQIKDYCRKKGVEVKILSSVRLQSGMRGKLKWCKTHLGLDSKNVILVKDALEKNNYANKRHLLIDDNPENVQAFISRNGRAYAFTEWNTSIVSEICGIIDKLK